MIEEGTFQAPDGVRLFYRFQPGSPEKDPLVILHGHGEHSGRYLKFFSKLEDLGHPIGISDLRGCGHSGGVPVHVSRFEEYLGDLSSFVDLLKSRYGVDRPLSLLGHSLGGPIATAWAVKNSGRVAKLILSSPLFGIPLSRLFRGLIPLLDRVAPRHVINNPVYPPFLTHDASEVERYKSDPLIQRRITVRLVHEMLRYSRLFAEQETEVPFPVYILMAEEDYVVQPQATRKFFEKLKAPKKELKGLAGFYHEIFNELGQEKAFEWLRIHLGR